MDRDFENRRIRDVLRKAHESTPAPRLSETWRIGVMADIRRGENSREPFGLWDFLAPRVTMAALALTILILALGLPAISTLSDDLLRMHAGQSYAAYTGGWLDN